MYSSYSWRQALGFVGFFAASVIAVGALLTLGVGTINAQAPETATVHATKIVCDNEADLPNYGGGGPDFDASTASAFLATHPNCHAEPGWAFEYVADVDSATNPGDNNLGGGTPWVTTGLTDGSGTVTFQVPVPLGGNKKVWFREALEAGYLPFTGAGGSATSAEFYCATDVLNYDNWDWINPVQSGAQYYCVAWNVQEKGSFTITKNTSGGDTEFTFNISGTLLNGDAYATTTSITTSEGSGSVTLSLPLSSGYTVTEGELGDGWTMDAEASTCDNGPVALGSAGAEAGCSFTNTYTPPATFRVCKIAVDDGGTVITGSGYDATFSVALAGPNDFSETATFTTPLDLTDDLVNDNGDADDAECVTYSVPAGSYTYEAEVITGENAEWTPTYHDFFTGVPDEVSDFFALTVDGQDGDNDDADGVINLVSGQTRTLAIVNTLIPQNSCVLPDTAGALGDVTFGVSTDSGSPTLESILDGAGYSIDTVADQENVQEWDGTVGMLNVTVTHVGGIAGNARAFGYYLNGDISTFVPLYKVNGSSPHPSFYPSLTVLSAGGTVSFSIPVSGSIGFAVKAYNGSVTTTHATAQALTTGGEQHAVVYNYDANQYVIGFEDLPFSSGDEDYQDLVADIEVTSCSDAPQCNAELGRTIVSDTSTKHGVNDTVPVDISADEGIQLHSAWTSIPGATWIWSTNPPVDTVDNLEETYTKTFSLAGSALGNGSLSILADNSYSVTLNGQPVCADATENNFGAVDTCVVPQAYFMTGVNTLSFTVKNWAQPNGTPQSNPAGLAYKLTFTENECEETPEEPVAQCVAGVELLTNGGFETPLVTNGANWDIFASNLTSWLTAWTGVSASGRPEVASLELQEEGISGGAWDAAGGAQWAELDSDWGGPDNAGLTGTPEAGSVMISQDIPTVAGKHYVLSFDFSARPGTGPLDNIVEAFADGVLGNTGQVDGGSLVNTDWNTFTFSFVAGDAMTNVGLRDIGTSNSLGSFVDNVSLKCVPTDVCPNDEGFQTDLEQCTVVCEQGSSNIDGSCVPNGETSADLEITKEVDVATPDAGDQITYTITVTNDGPHGADNIVVVESLPDGLTYVSHTASNGNDNYDAGTGEWYIAFLGVEGTATLTLVMEVGEEEEGNVIVNVVSIEASDSIDNDPENNEDSVTVTVNGSNGGGDSTPTDLCSNIDGVQASVPNGMTQSAGECIAPANGAPVGGGGGGGVSGLVAGASTGPIPQVLGVSCGLSMDQHLRFGSKLNKADQVRVLQRLLNKYVGANLPITGFFGPLTEAAVKSFQAKYSKEVLAPWGISTPTGIVYFATLRQLNLLECPTLALNLPALIQWSKNPRPQ